MAIFFILVYFMESFVPRVVLEYADSNGVFMFYKFDL